MGRNNTRQKSPTGLFQSENEMIRYGTDMYDGTKKTSPGEWERVVGQVWGSA